MDDPKETDNPWLVSSFEEFLFYCCPECDIKTKELSELFDHAVQEHQLAKETLTESEVKAPEIAEESMKDHTELADDDDEPSVDYKKHEFAVDFENQNQDKDPLATNISEIATAGQIKIDLDEDFTHDIQDANEVTGEIVNKCRCNFCSLPFETTIELKKHLTQCSHLRQFQEEENLAEQSKRKSEKIVFKCPNIQELIIDKGEILKHKKMCKSSPDSQNSHKIDIESAPVVTKKQRITPNSSKKVKKCPHCSFESDLPHIFKRHTNSFRICTVCSEIFCGERSAQKFRTHQNTHKVKPLNQCEICNKSFKIPSLLKKHYIQSACGRQVDY